MASTFSPDGSFHRVGSVHGVDVFTACIDSRRGPFHHGGSLVPQVISSRESFCLKDLLIYFKGFEKRPPRLKRRHISHPTNNALLQQQRRENVAPQLQRPKSDAHSNQTAGLAYMERCFTAIRASRGTTTHAVLPWRGRRGDGETLYQS